MVCAVLLSSLAGCTTPAGSPDPAARVAVSIFPLYDLTRRVAGEAERVELLLAAGGDAHVASLSARQVARLSQVRLIVGVGPGFDTWSLDAARRAGAAPEVLWLGGSVALEDPHIWLDPIRMRAAVVEIAEALGRIDPGGRDGYRERARGVSGALESLDAEIRRRAELWPERAVVTAHAFLGPFAERYGVRVAAVLDPLPGRELTPRRLSEILAAIRDEDRVAAILVPSGEVGAAARVAAEESGLPLVELDVVGGRPSDRYESVLRGMVAAIEGCLG